MKHFIFLLLFINVAATLYSQNVGIGTNAPAERLDVNGNFNVSGLIKLNGLAGGNGDVLTSNGAVMGWTRPVYTLSQSNFLATSVPAENYVRITGAVTLAADYIGLNAVKLTITGGSFTGNSLAVLKLGSNTCINGTSFTDVDIEGNFLTFINCNFSGNCARAGLDAQFINCTFSSVNMTSAGRIGAALNCSFLSSTVPRINRVAYSEVSNTVLGGLGSGGNELSSIDHCMVSNSSLYALQSEFVCTGNKCRQTKIYVGSSTQSPSNVTISNNQFNNLLGGTSEVIELRMLPSNFRIYNIQNNHFLLQAADFCSIRLSENDGNPFGNTLVSVQGNTFFRGSNTLYYASNVKTVYSQNIAFSSGHPGASGNLVLNNNSSF